MWRRLIRPYYGYAHSAAFNADKVITKWILCAISQDGVQLAHVRHYSMTMDIFRNFIRATFASVTRTRFPSITSCLSSDGQFRNKMCQAEPNKDGWNGCVKPNIARVYQPLQGVRSRRVRSVVIRELRSSGSTLRANQLRITYAQFIHHHKIFHLAMCVFGCSHPWRNINNRRINRKSSWCMSPDSEAERNWLIFICPFEIEN